MGWFSNYEKVGPGVSKNPEDKLPVFKFFGIYFSHFSKLILLNFIYIVALLPFALVMLLEYYFGDNVGAYYVVFYIAFILFGAILGPATCGFMKICRNISTERPIFLLHDFIKAFKSNFVQGAAMGIIDMIFIVLMTFAFPLYYSMSLENSMLLIPFLICLVCSVIFLMMHFYIYLLIVSTNLSIWKILKNSFFLTAIEIKVSIINLVVTFALCMFVVIFFPLSAFMLVIVPSFLGLLYAFNCFPVIRKYVIQPWYDQRGEANPEFEYLESKGESVFVDTPETEVPPLAPEKKKSGGKSKNRRIR